MTYFDREATDHRRRDLEAAGWVVRRDAGLTAAEQDEYLQWLAADPRRGQAIARQQQTWREFGLLAQWKPEHSAEPNPDLLAQPRRSWRFAWGAALLATAACLTVLVWVRSTPAPEALSVARAYERRALEDGSVVEMKRGTALVVAYTRAERRIELLRGEANFIVAKSPARPFVVHTAGVDVRAVGTAFNVRLDDQKVAVLVTEGRVVVAPSGSGGDQWAEGREPAKAGDPTIPILVNSSPSPLLQVSAGETTVVSLQSAAAPPQVLPATPQQLAAVRAWQPQRLEFNSTPLAEVAAAFNQHNDVQLVIADADLRTMPIVASMQSDNVDGFVRLLTQSAGVKVQRSEDTITLRRAR